MKNSLVFLRRRQVLAKIGLCNASLYARLDPNSPSFDPTFPKQVRLSPSPKGSVAWLESEVDDWMTSRLMAR